MCFIQFFICNKPSLCSKIGEHPKNGLKENKICANKQRAGASLDHSFRRHIEYGCPAWLDIWLAVNGIRLGPNVFVFLSVLLIFPAHTSFYWRVLNYYRAIEAADLANMMLVLPVGPRLCPFVLPVRMTLKTMQHSQIYIKESDTADFKP